MSTEHVSALESAVREAIRQAEFSADELALMAEEGGADIGGRRRKCRDVARLAACLAKLIDRRTAREIHDAFGAPGDWGYETPIGEALYALYSATPSEKAGLKP